MAEPSLKHKTTVSLFWSFIDKFGQQVLNFVSMLVLMNIVATEAYGLIGSLALFTALSTILIDSGLGRVLINRKDVSLADYNAVFLFNAALSATLYLILFFISPLIANLFNAPQLVPVSRVLFLTLIFNALGLIHQTILIKKADFKSLTKVNMLALLIADVVAIAMALTGFGVWALVSAASFFNRAHIAVLGTLFVVIRTFNLSRVKSYFGFSYKLLLSNLVSSTVNNIYPSIIATFYPLSQVAYFDRAKKYQEIPFLTLSNTFRSVAMLILSEVNQQQERLVRVVRKLIKSIAFLAFPIAFLMILIAEPTFYLFFKEKWLASVPYFQVLTLGGMLLPFTFIFNELFIAKERAAYFLGLEVVKGALLLLLIVLFFPRGIMGLAVSWVVYTVITLSLSIFFAGKVIRYSMLKFAKDTFPYLVSAGLSVAVAYFVARGISSGLLFILASTAATGIIYIALCRMLGLEMTKEIDTWFRRKRGENKQDG